MCILVKFLSGGIRQKCLLQNSAVVFWGQSGLACVASDLTLPGLKFEHHNKALVSLPSYHILVHVVGEQMAVLECVIVNYNMVTLLRLLY